MAHSHLDSLEVVLGTGDSDWKARFEELGPAYEKQAASL
jgi:hypothetical protein